MSKEISGRLLIKSSKSFPVTIPKEINVELLKQLGGERSVLHVKNPALFYDGGFPTGRMMCHFAPIPEDAPNGDTPTIVLSILDQYKDTLWPHPIYALMHIYEEHFDMLDTCNYRYITAPDFHKPWATNWIDVNSGIWEDDFTRKEKLRLMQKKFRANGKEFPDLFVPIMQGETKEDISIGIARPSGIPWHGDIQFVYFTKE